MSTETRSWDYDSWVEVAAEGGSNYRYTITYRGAGVTWQGYPTGEPQGPRRNPLGRYPTLDDLVYGDYPVLEDLESGTITFTIDEVSSVTIAAVDPVRDRWGAAIHYDYSKSRWTVDGGHLLGSLQQSDSRLWVEDILIPIDLGEPHYDPEQRAEYPEVWVFLRRLASDRPDLVCGSTLTEISERCLSESSEVFTSNRPAADPVWAELWAAFRAEVAV